MSVTTVRVKHQITIPRAIREKLDIAEGDQVEIREEGGRIVIEPVRTVPADQAWFWTPRWQAMEQEADEDIRAGRSSGIFEDAKSLKAHLDSLKKK